MITLNKRIIAITISITIAVLVFFLVIYDANTTYGFYRVPVQTKNAITALIQKSNEHCQFIDFDTSKNLTEQKRLLKKIDVLFTIDSTEVKKSPVFTKEISARLKIVERGMTSPMRTIGIVKTADGYNRYALAVLNDHFEILYCKQHFADSSYPRTFDMIESTTNKVTGAIQAPIAVAGGDNATLLAFIGAITEALYGQDTWTAVAQLLCDNINKIQTDSDFEALCKKPLGTQKVTLQDILSVPARWEANGLLHSQWASFQLFDMSALMETQQAAVVFMTLSEHRALPHATAEQYVSSFIPGSNKAGMRHLTMPIVTACFPNKRPDKRSIQMLAEITGQEQQAILSTITGLAPVNAQSETSDRQSSDVRVWAAASGTVLPPLGAVVCQGSADEEVLARSIRNRIAAIRTSLATNKNQQ